MTVMVRIEGLDGVLRELRDRVPRTRRRARYAMRKGAVSTRDRLQPETPLKTGQLQDSLFAQKVTGDADHLEVKIGPGKSGFYGRFLEYGTSKMAPHPWLGPGFQRIAREIQQEIINELLKEF